MDVPGAGAVWFDPDAITNIFSFSLLSDKFHITFDNKKEDAFIVHLQNSTIKFKRDNDGLYQFHMTKAYFNKKKSKTASGEHTKIPKKMPCHLVATRAENRKNFIEQQFEWAKRAWDLYHSVGMPSVDKFKGLL